MPRVNTNDSLVCLRLPNDVINELKNYANQNARSLKEEILARLRVTLRDNETLMSQDRLLCLIFNRDLAYKE